MRNTIEDVGDYEQYNTEFYSVANYFELYVMSSFGEDRKHFQIYNKFDSCCFAGNTSEYYENSIKNSISELQLGYFDIIIDDTHSEHKISDYTIDSIIDMII